MYRSLALAELHTPAVLRRLSLTSLLRVLSLHQLRVLEAQTQLPVPLRLHLHTNEFALSFYPASVNSRSSLRASSLSACRSASISSLLAWKEASAVYTCAKDRLEYWSTISS